MHGVDSRDTPGAAPTEPEPPTRRSVLVAYATPSLAGALLFTCGGRGAGLFGAPHHDAGAIRQHLGPDLPLAGFFCAGEIGPVGGRPFLHGFTASVGLLRARG